MFHRLFLLICKTLRYDIVNKKLRTSAIDSPDISLLLLFFRSQAADLSKPIDKRIYKGTQPTCHDFNPLTATADSVSLLVGFSAGQVQLIDPIKKETSKLFNEEVGAMQACRIHFTVASECLIFMFSVRGESSESCHLLISNPSPCTSSSFCVPPRG